MTEPERRDPVDAGDEKDLLAQFLDYHRATVHRKIDGVGDDDLRRPMGASTMSMLGIVKHLGYVELDWFQRDFLGQQEIPVPWSKEDPDADFRIEPGETTQSVVEFYTEQAQRSREITASATLDDIAKVGRPSTTLRWILLHMIEETSRHNGHLDIFREMIDGARGV